MVQAIWGTGFPFPGGQGDVARVLSADFVQMTIGI